MLDYSKVMQFSKFCLFWRVFVILVKTLDFTTVSSDGKKGGYLLGPSKSHIDCSAVFGS